LRFERALTLVELEVDAAEVDMEATQLMARHPDRAGGYFIQGLLFERSREWQNALVMFREAQRAEPAYAFAGLGEARVLLELGDSPGFRERVGSLRPLVRNVPEQRAELLRLASLHAERDGRFEDALMEMELAVQAAPGNVQLHVGLARLRAKVSDNLGARAALEQALLLSPGFPPARAALDELSRKATAAGDLPD
jgi:tetratricopeptide (TPR) repeat protein